MFYSEHTVLTRFADDSKLLYNVFNALGRRGSSSIKPLKMIFDRMISMPPGEEVQKGEKKQKL